MSTALTETADAGEKPEEKKKKTSPFATAVVGDTGIRVQNGAEMWSLAVSISESGLAPKGLDKPASVLIALQMGYELGLPPMAALQNIAIVNGRPTLWGDAQLAVCRATGELEIFQEWYEQNGERLPRNPVTYTDDTVAVCMVKRRGHETVEVGFSVADAKRADLWTKAGTWKQYPFRMLRYRARGYALRDAFGDALRGLYSTDEIENIPTIDALSVSPSNGQSPASRTDALRSKLQEQVRTVEDQPTEQTSKPAKKSTVKEKAVEQPAEPVKEHPTPEGNDPYSEADLREMLSYASTQTSLRELKAKVMESPLAKEVKVELCTAINDRIAELEEEAANAS